MTKWGSEIVIFFEVQFEEIMMRSQNLLFLLGLTCVTILACSTPGFGASLDEVQNQIIQTNKKLAETKKREKSVLGTLVKTQQELERIDNNLAKLSHQIGNTEQQIASLTSQVNQAESELKQLKVQIGGRQGVLDKRLKALYMHGYQSWLEFLFNVKDFSEFISRFEMFSRFAKVDLNIIQSLQAKQSIIIDKKREIQEKQQELTDQKILFVMLKDQNKQAMNQKLAVTENKQKELETLQGSRSELEKALDELEQTSKEVEAQIRAYQEKNQIYLGTGSYIWPVRGRLAQKFGWRVHPILRRRQFHTGLDIAVEHGTPIMAADSGVVIFAGFNGGYGKMLLVDHGSGFSTLYAHTSLLLVDKGQTVIKGQIIAKVGTTGLSTGPHLHFEIRKNGTPVNPLDYL
jgi:murein DD-endopeptidase MepM/ murein hydrolase activator NlpD